jgi:hypothetical protein
MDVSSRSLGEHQHVTVGPARQRIIFIEGKRAWPEQLLHIGHDRTAVPT